MADNPPYSFGDQGAPPLTLGVNITKFQAFSVARNTAQITWSQVAEPGKLQGDTHLCFYNPRGAEKTCSEPGEPRTEGKGVCNRVEVNSELVIQSNCESTHPATLDRRARRYEVDGGVTIAGGRPGEEMSAEGLESSRSSATLPPPYSSIPYS